MVLTGHPGENKLKLIKETLARASSKMVAKSSALQHTPSLTRHGLRDSDGEADYNLTTTLSCTTAIRYIATRLL